jgi:hypothetical protein
MAKRKRANKLAEYYELEENTCNCYYNYIVDSLINGQRQQVRSLFNQMHKEDKKEFLSEFISMSDEPYHIEVREICINELIK